MHLLADKEAGRRYCFELRNDKSNKILWFGADDSEEFDQWVNFIFPLTNHSLPPAAQVEEDEKTRKRFLDNPLMQIQHEIAKEAQVVHHQTLSGKYKDVIVSNSNSNPDLHDTTTTDPSPPPSQNTTKIYKSALPPLNTPPPPLPSNPAPPLSSSDTANEKPHVRFDKLPEKPPTENQYLSTESQTTKEPSPRGAHPAALVPPHPSSEERNPSPNAVKRKSSGASQWAFLTQLLPKSMTPTEPIQRNLERSATNGSPIPSRRHQVQVHSSSGDITRQSPNHQTASNLSS